MKTPLEIPDDAEIFLYKGKIYNLLLIDDVLDDYITFEQQLAEAHQLGIEKGRKQAARECVAIVDSYIKLLDWRGEV